MQSESVKNSPKAVFLDIDGTLVSRGEGPFDEDLEQIEAAWKGGHKIFLSTGRSLANVPASLKKLPFIDGMALGSGAHVVYEGKTIYRKQVSPEALGAVCALYLKKSRWCVFEGVSRMYGINRFDPALFAGEVLPIADKDDFFTRYRDAVVTKLTLEGFVTPEERAALETYFQINPLTGYSEAVIKGEDKSHAMEILLKAADIPRENSIAIGDSVNDMTIIRAAGLGIAMGNACDELKRIAGYITGGCGQGGVGAALKRWVLSRPVRPLA
ncbi:MAG: Cof-type HAD-IIB family hydrolase [Treponema sp.]|jgi:Cof subfamily protein (haloacid dehalogenase superfamily)|nr:Cof-type HAD-IIB family hydrolase [Treponema sp.]